MAVEGAEERRDALVKKAVERIAAHRSQYPLLTMPWNKLEALYKGGEKEPIAKLVAAKARKLEAPAVSIT